MPSNGHKYIAPTIHAFKEFICPWLGLVVDRCNFHTFSLGIQSVRSTFALPSEKKAKATMKLKQVTEALLPQE